METPRGGDRNLDGETPGQEERELQAISGTPEEEGVINQIGITVDDTHEPLGGDDEAEAAARRSSRARSEEVARGRVVAVAANPYGELEDVCGVCLENPGNDAMVSLWCCKNILCIFDARKLGACPFCREEPVVWNLRVAGPPLP